MSKSKSSTHIIVGMSGGVDSSVSALLLKQQGYHVSGLFMKNWDEDDGSEYCTAQKDLDDAEAVCQTLNIPLHTANFSSEYWDNVFEHFLSEYQAGRTPNPDVLCNKEIKFKVFLDYAIKLGADFIATGHYAQLYQDKHGFHLLKGHDPLKDQSYFLNQVSENELKQTLFPIGHLCKDKVRTIAKEHDLSTQDKKDSTGICFIGERRFTDFLESYLPANPGNILTDTGEIIGQHNGLMFHTIGQRKGLGIGGLKNKSEGSWYVCDKNISNNNLVVVQGKDHERLFKRTLYVSELKWINEKFNPSFPLVCSAKTRYRQVDQECTVTKNDNGFLITFKTQQRAITPGQYLVLYNENICLGGGIIQYAYE
jgi:tRNA-uridine 2-sulfurtransferase